MNTNQPQFTNQQYPIMVGGSSNSSFKSQVFKVVVGSTAEIFYAHADILAKSVVLKETVQGPWRENVELTLYWRDWEASAVERFLEWLYTGDYQCPYPVEACETESTSQPSAEASGESSDHSPPAESENVEVLEYLVPAPAEPVEMTFEDSILDVPSRHKSTAKKLKSTKKGTACARSTIRPLTRLEDLTWNGCRALEKSTEAEEYDQWMGHQLWRPDELDYENTFMTHAKLYVMACFYLLDALKNMSWQRLRSVLISIGKPSPRTPVIGNVMTLIHYVYQETGDHSTDEEPLRMLVTSFAALHYTNLEGTGVKNLLLSAEETDREFVVDLFEKVARQMSYLEGKDDTTDVQTPTVWKGARWSRR